MAIAIDPTEEFDYVLKSDRKLPAEQQTVFKLRPLSFRARAQLEDEAMAWQTGADGASQGVMRSGSNTANALRAGLIGWANFRDRNGDEVEFKQDKMLNVLGEQLRPASYETLGRLHPDAAAELAEAIREVQHLTEADAGN